MKIKQNSSIKKFRKSNFQRLFFLIVTFGMMAFFPTPAQAKVDEQSLKSAIETLKR
jgi:hypothetical protein